MTELYEGKRLDRKTLRPSSTVRFQLHGLSEGSHLLVTNRGGSLHLEFMPAGSVTQPYYPFVSEDVTLAEGNAIAVLPQERPDSNPVVLDAHEGQLRLRGKNITTIHSITHN